MAQLSEVTFVFRKRTSATFSIEKLFEALYAGFSSNSAANGFRVRRVEMPDVSTGIISVLRNIWFLRRQKKSTCIHVTGDVHYASLLRPFVPTIITIHDCVVLQRGRGLKLFVLWLIWFWLPVRFASAVTVISEQTKRELLKTVSVPDAKISVISNFVDPGFVFTERPFAADSPRILHIGTAPHKNLARVIPALRGLQCTLVIVGKLSHENLQDLADNGIPFENHLGVDHPTIVGLYRDADIISFPSTYEGFGMPILEGQATGRPVLTSALDPMSSVAGPDGALIVNPFSEEAIREGFLSLIKNSELRSRLVAAGRVNCAQYSIETVSMQYRELYRRLAR